MQTKGMILFGASLLAVLGVSAAYSLSRGSDGAGSQDATSETLAVYEAIRGLLANDQLEKVASEADRLAKAAERAAERSEGALKARLTATAGSAGQFKDAKDLATARLAFGNLSREVVGMLRAEPSLARGRYVYRCPMVKEGYALWVQTAREISNPYMGKAMARCGAPADLKD